MTSSVDAEYRWGHGGDGGYNSRFDSPPSQARQLGARGDRNLSAGREVIIRDTSLVEYSAPPLCPYQCVLSSLQKRQVDYEGRAQEGAAAAAAAVASAAAIVLSKGTTGRSVPFPLRLFMMIRREAIQHPAIVRWSADGCAFFVDDDNVFVNEILPQYGFKASKMQSFQVYDFPHGFSTVQSSAVIDASLWSTVVLCTSRSFLFFATGHRTHLRHLTDVLVF